jgi:predicted enzyme related to lactoylglutathione lyase
VERKVQGEFTWVDLAAKDLEGQTIFYEDLFGWRHTDVPTDVGPIYRMFQKNGQTVAGASQTSPDMAVAGVPTMWNTYIAADDVDAVAARAVELGGQIAMPAMDVMDQGRMVGIQDPTGATVFFWKASAHNGAQLFGDPGSLGWSELNTRDPGQAIAFYGELIGWKIEPLDAGTGPYWQVSVNGTGEGGIQPMPDMVPPQVPAYWLVYFGTEDARAAAERAKSLGATAQMEPMEVPGMLIFDVLADPAGATFALLQPLSPA